MFVTGLWLDLQIAGEEFFAVGLITIFLGDYAHDYIQTMSNALPPRPDVDNHMGSFDSRLQD